MNKCGACGKFLTGGATCPKCKGLYHKQCVNLTSTHTPKHWLCPGCVISAPRKDNTDTPVKEVEDYRHEESPLQSDDCSEQKLILDEIRTLRTEMNGFRKEFGCFREQIHDEMKDLRAMYQDCNGKINEFGERFNLYDARILKLEAGFKESQDLKLQVFLLKQELNSKEQLALENVVEISGVTENSGENISHVTGLIMNKIGVKLDEQDVVDICRVGPVRSATQDSKQRPRPIVLRLTRRAVREQVLRSARARRTITTGDIELAGTAHRIYINERLTRENRLLFTKARLLCKQHSWKYAWTRDGRILIREVDGKMAFRVRNETDLETIFKKRQN